jgi:hypothetical protein
MLFSVAFSYNLGTALVFGHKILVQPAKPLGPPAIGGSTFGDQQPSGGPVHIKNNTAMHVC